MRKPKASSTAIAVVSKTGNQLAIPNEYAQAARAAAANSRSERTRKEYARCWRDYVRWCDEHSRDALPAIAHEPPPGTSKVRREAHSEAYAAALKESLATVLAYVLWLGAQEGRGRTWSGKDAAPVPLAATTIGVHVAAIKLAFQTAYHAPNWKSPAFTEVMKGLRRGIAGKRIVRQASPLSPDDLRDILDSLKPEVLRDARDAAVLALGWGGCRRVSEIASLDWLEKNTGRGFIKIEKDGVFITLLTSKTSQDKPQQYIITRRDTPRLVEAVERWIEIAKIERGAPVLRGLMGPEGTFIKPSRMGANNVSIIIKRRIERLLKARNGGRKKIPLAELRAMVTGFSSHSMRVGSITSMHDRGIPIPRIQSHSGHKTAAMVIHYGVVHDKLKDHPNKGVGL